MAMALSDNRVRVSDRHRATPLAFSGRLMCSSSTARLGSIHSMKGKTVDSVLIFGTEIYRGLAKAD